MSVWITSCRRRSPGCRGWQKSNVLEILTNPVYTGVVVYGKRSQSAFHAVEGDRVRELAEGETARTSRSHLADE